MIYFCLQVSFNFVCKTTNILISYKKTYESDYEWLRVTTSDYESDYEWLRVTTSDYEWLRVTTS